MNQSALVLIADDEEYFREIFSLKLEALGYRVAMAENGEQAVAKAKELKPNLVLMDVQMPGSGGIEALMKLREDPKTKDMKIIFLTGLGEDSSAKVQQTDKKFASEVGADGYIRKTDDLNVIMSKIVSYL